MTASGFIPYVTHNERPGPRSVRHHYVPRFYLSRFADQKGRIRAFHRPTGRVFTTSAASIAAESDLYSVIDRSGLVSGAVEEIISGIESRVAPSLTRLAEEGWPPSLETRGLVANFIALQLTRTRESFQAMAAIYDRASKLPFEFMTLDQLRAVVVEHSEDDLSAEEIDELAEDLANTESYRVVPSKNVLVDIMLRAASELVEPIARRRWFLERTTKRLIVTSDSPVVLWSPPGHYGVGALNASEILLPVDSRHCLLLVADDQGWPESIVDIPPRIARGINRRVAGASYEWVFADPRSSVLESMDLPVGPRPVAYFGGDPIFGESTGHRDQ